MKNKLVILFFLAIIVYSMVIRVKLYLLGVSLWYDESLLAMNIVGRSMTELLTPPLAAMQSAPMGYLAVVKAIVTALGASEAAVRIYSFAALIVMLVCEWRLLKSVLRLSPVFVWFCLALTATFPLYMRYSNELKPYMGDVCAALLVLVLYWLYREKKLPIFVMTAICAALILLSSPAIFFVASALGVEFARLLLRGDFKAAVRLIPAGLIPAAVFILHYVFWLRGTDDMMFYWWERYRFLLPLSRGAISADLRMLREFFYPFGDWKMLFIALGAAGFVLSLLKKNIYTAIVAVSFALLLFASNRGMYPIISRLWLFFYVFTFMYAVNCIASIRTSFLTDRRDDIGCPPADARAGFLDTKAETRRRRLRGAVVCAALCVVALAGNYTFPNYAKGEPDTLIPGMQINPLIEYVRDNIENGERLYCFETASAALGFKNGYGNNRIGDVTEDNIIWGDGSFEQIYLPVDTDAKRIADAKYAYVMFYRGYLPDSLDDRMPELTRLLSAEGYLDKVLDVNYTPLYWFSKDLAHLKTGASLEVVDYAGEKPENSLVVRIVNTGKTVLEAEDADREGAIPLVSGAVKAVVRLYKDGVLLSETPAGGIEAPLLPGETVDILVTLPPTGDADRATLDLVSEGRFRFSEIGMPPVVIVP